MSTEVAAPYSMASRAVQTSGIIRPELGGATLATRAPLRFPIAQLDAADLARDRLRQNREFKPADPLVRSESGLAELENAARRLGVLLDSRPQHDERLRHGEPHRIGAGDDCGLRHSIVLEQRALDLERADAIVAALEDIVATADEVHVSVGIAPRFVAGAVEARSHREVGPRGVVDVPVHQPERPRRQAKRQLAFVALAPFGVEHHDVVAGKRLAHRAGLHRQAGSVAYQGGRFGLAVSVANRDAPGPLDGLDHFRVQRFACARQLSQARWTIAERLEGDHAPDRRRGAQRGDFLVAENLDRPPCRKARALVHQNGCAGIPRREKARPGMLGPAGRADVLMHICPAEAQPIHRRQVADGIARVRVQDQLRFRGRPGGEIQQQRLICASVHILDLS